MLRQAVNRSLTVKRFKVQYGAIKERPQAARKVQAITGHQQMKDTTLLKVFFEKFSIYKRLKWPRSDFRIVI